MEYHPDFNEMTISSTVLVKDLYISHNSRYLKLSENYFDLVPGHVKKVLLIGV